MKKVMSVTIAIVFIAAVVGLSAWFISGAIYIGADKPHSAITTWVLHNAMEHSVKSHCKSLKPPQTNDSLIKFGFAHFHAMCVMCHVAPGFEPSEVGRGLTPPPPNLQKALVNWNSTEKYWIVEHGVKMTGMPSFGVTHSREELNAIVSFLQIFPNMSKTEYAGFVNSTPVENEER
jgi:mono/diheme cytochrome c family protein